MTSWVDVADLPYSLQFVIYLPYFIGMFFNLVHEFYFQYRYRQVLAREKADPKNPRAGYTPIINDASLNARALRPLFELDDDHRVPNLVAGDQFVQ